jgi:hypothetical protein
MLHSELRESRLFGKDYQAWLTLYLLIDLQYELQKSWISNSAMRNRKTGLLPPAKN